MLKDTAIELSGNDRYEGYAIDIIQQLSEKLNFEYEIIIQSDGNYGVYSNDTGWDGMIGKIIAEVRNIIKLFHFIRLTYFNFIFYMLGS